MTTVTLKEHDVDIRETVLEEFVAIVNIVEPEHYYERRFDELYPLQPSEVDYGYCRSDGPFYAKCGPRLVTRTGRFVQSETKCGFKIDKAAFASMHPERRLVVYVHEMCHFQYGSHDKSSSVHPPEMWRHMAFYSQLTLDAWDAVTDIIHGPLSVDMFKSKLQADPNGSMVDRRRQTTDEVAEEIKKFTEDYSPGIA
jgi:hypothetical protein